ncbi:hypothetical protein D9V37_13725 [Nocardioides mangrovicus]|uniref:Flagellar FliJ protein n=1 Tax=Nocardioides mangrovicus TaxID=2478913 RepID=A0A3L8P019_9ACTN|nr:flagellar FliJ family protein [Nocardioides mangrovicus]RLV48776.1 hypothetical protein D9V37_13725 [Nocardioides mangrovicus]
MSGLEAVARVRRVREEDSRYGLLMAEREVNRAGEQVARLDRQLTSHGTTTVSSAGELVQLRQGLLALGELLQQAREDLESAQNVSLSARAHWQADRTRLRSIEMLQERRRDEARAERARAEARSQDEVATQLWLRTRTTGPVAS